MIYTLHFRTNNLTLPMNYHGKVQGLIYHLTRTSPAYGAFLHDAGYEDDAGRKFKLFCFSELTGEHICRNKLLIFPHQVSIELRTADPMMAKTLTEALIPNNTYLLGGQRILLERVETKEIHLEESQYKIRMLSPIAAYQRTEDNKTRYFNPLEREFSQNVNENYRRKWSSATGEDAEGNVKLIALSVGERDKCVTQIKGIWVTAWSGIYLIKGQPEALEFLYCTGLGAKNSMGFGLFEIVK